MAITNKDLMERIDKIFKQVNKNYTGIAVLSEHVNNQNNRIDKIEIRMEEDRKISKKHRWDVRLIAYGGMVSFMTYILIIGVRLVLGV